jgi:hypothetical protein
MTPLYCQYGPKPFAPYICRFAHNSTLFNLSTKEFLCFYRFFLNIKCCVNLWTLFENGAESNKIINAYVLFAICGLLVLNGVQNLHLKFVVNEIITKFLFQSFVKP